MRWTALVLAVLYPLGQSWADDLSAVLDRTRQLVETHRYQEVIELLEPFSQVEDTEARYAVAAEIGRAYFHLGNYPAADAAFREAVTLRPQRTETALYLQATSYLTGDRDQAYTIFREILASHATDLYLAVTLPGERAFVADPAVWEILDEFADHLKVDIDHGGILGVELGQGRPEVERTLGVDPGTEGSALTARAGPFLTWAFGFDDDGELIQIILHNEHLLRYTPYRLHLGPDIDWRSTPDMATRSLGAPTSITSNANELVTMTWQREQLRLTLEFAPPRTPVPYGFVAGQPVLRMARLEEAAAEPAQTEQ